MKKFIALLLSPSVLAASLLISSAAIAADDTGVRFPDDPMQLSAGFKTQLKDGNMTLTITPSKVGSSFLVSLLEEGKDKKVMPTMTLFMGTLLMDRAVGLNLLAPSKDGQSYIRRAQPEGVIRFIVNSQHIVEKVLVQPQPTALVLPELSLDESAGDVVAPTTFKSNESYKSKLRDLQIHRDQKGALLVDVSASGWSGTYALTNLLGLGIIRAVSYDANYNLIESPQVAAVLLKGNYRGKAALYDLVYSPGSPFANVDILKPN